MVDHLLLWVFSQLAKMAGIDVQSFAEGLVKCGRGFIADAHGNFRDACLRVFLQHPERGKQSYAAQEFEWRFSGIGLKQPRKMVRRRPRLARKASKGHGLRQMRPHVALGAADLRAMELALMRFLPGHAPVYRSRRQPSFPELRNCRRRCRESLRTGKMRAESHPTRTAHDNRSEYPH